MEDRSLERTLSGGARRPRGPRRSQESPRSPRKPKRPPEAPGSTRRRQEAPGGHTGSQVASRTPGRAWGPRTPKEITGGPKKPQALGSPRRPQEVPGGSRKSQEAPSNPRRPQEAPGGPRTFLDCPGGAWRYKDPSRRREGEGGGGAGGAGGNKKGWGRIQDSILQRFGPSTPDTSHRANIMTSHLFSYSRPPAALAGRATLTKLPRRKYQSLSKESRHQEGDNVK